MLRQVFSKIYYLLMGTKDSFMYRSLFLLLIVSPVIVMAFINYAYLDTETSKSILAERRSLARLAGATVHENLDNLVNLGISYATRPRLIENIEKGNWQGAVNVTTQALEFFPSFDRIVLYDPQGVIKADAPHAIPNVIGQSRADKEWYNGVKRNWEPYISGTFIRGAEPRIPVVTVVVPIKTMSSLSKAVNPAAREGRKVIGILQLQVKLDIFSHWIDRINIGPGSIIYVVDQYGCIVYHPKYAQAKTVTDFSSVGIVAKVMKGIGGAEVNYNPVEKEERLAAYEPLSSYGWGIVITQPVGLAYLEKNVQLKHVLITYSIIVLLAGAIALLILYSIVTHKQAEDALRESEGKYHLLAEHTKDIVWLMDMDTRTSYQSPSSEILRGYSLQELRDMPLEKHLTPDSLKLVMELLFTEIPKIEANPGYNPVPMLELEYYRKDGTTVWMENKYSVIRSESGKPVSILGEGRDITERKRAEKARDELILKLQEALAKVKLLSGLLPICASCKKIRNDKGYWEQTEMYIRDHSEAQFSHGICPDCTEKLYPEVYEKMYKNKED